MFCLVGPTPSSAHRLGSFLADLHLSALFSMGRGKKAMRKLSKSEEVNVLRLSKGCRGSAALVDEEAVAAMKKIEKYLEENPLEAAWVYRGLLKAPSIIGCRFAAARIMCNCR